MLKSFLIMVITRQTSKCKLHSIKEIQFLEFIFAFYLSIPHFFISLGYPAPPRTKSLIMFINIITFGTLTRPLLPHFSTIHASINVGSIVFYHRSFIVSIIYLYQSFFGSIYYQSFPTASNVGSIGAYYQSFVASYSGIQSSFHFILIHFILSIHSLWICSNFVSYCSYQTQMIINSG